MIMRLSAAVHRRRVPLLLIAVAVTALVAGALKPEAAAVVLLAIGISFLVLGLVVAVTVLQPGQARPVFIVDEALHTPRAGVLPLLCAAILSLSGLGLIAPPGPPVWVIGLFCAAFLGVCARATLVGIGLTISPEGLRADKFMGSVTVPWAAVDPDQIGSGPFEVHLRYRAPELVRTTGWVINPGKLRVDGVTPGFAAATIQHYALNPGERMLIGTPAGQLHPSSRATPPTGTASPRGPGRGPVVTVLVLAVLMGAGAVIVDLRVGAGHGNTSVAGIAAHLLTVAFVLLALRLIRGSVLLLRRRS